MPPRALVAVVLSLLFPGLGQGVSGRRGRMVVVALVVLLAMLLLFVSVWVLPAMLVLRVIGAVDAYRALKPEPASFHWVNAAIAVALGAAGIASSEVSVDAFHIPSSSMTPTLVIGDQIYVDKLSLRWRPPARGEVVVFEHPCGPRIYVKRVIAVGGDTVEVRCGTVFVNGRAAPASLVAASATYSERDEARSAWVSRSASRYRETLDGASYETLHRSERPTHTEANVADEQGDFPRRDRPFAPSCRPAAFYDRSSPNLQPMGTLVETQPLATARACEPQLHLAVPAGALFVMGDNRSNANDSRYWGLVATRAVIGRAIGIWSSSGPDGGWSRFGAIE